MQNANKNLNSVLLTSKKLFSCRCLTMNKASFTFVFTAAAGTIYFSSNDKRKGYFRKVHLNKGFNNVLAESASVEKVL